MWNSSDNHLCVAHRNQQIANTMINSAQCAAHVLQTACIQDSNYAGFQAQWSSTTLCICYRHFGMMGWGQWTHEACHINSWGYLSCLRDSVTVWGILCETWNVNTSKIRVICGCISDHEAVQTIYRTIYLQILQNNVAAQLPNLTSDFPTPHWRREVPHYFNAKYTGCWINRQDTI